VAHVLNFHPDSIEKTIKDNINKLADKDGLVREKARKLLVSLGSPAIDYLSEYETHPKDVARWEAVKALADINEPIAAPLLVNALDDKNGDVRWLAAEGLSELGEDGLKAVLEALLEEPDSVYMRRGAHHVLTKMAEHTVKPEIRELLDILDAPDADLKILLQAEPYLEKLSKEHYKVH
jgi:HEAT repeat protein